jgi:TolB-like protein/Tfp pilus assembly protein PilF
MEAQPEPVRKPSVFLSYSRADQKRALPVIAAFEKAGIDVWWDGLLEGGQTFLHKTEAALQSADAVVVLWSKISTASNWVRDEAQHGRERNCLVPLSLDGSIAPLGFRQIQQIDLSKWRGNANAPEIQQAIRAVAALAGAESRAPLPITRPPLVSRRVMIGGGAALGIGGAGLIGWETGLFGGGAVANSIAVLPFDNLSGDKAQDYFADGLSAEMRASLGRNGALRVMGQASSEAFRDGKIGAVEIAKKLGVAFLLDGNVLIAGPAVKITVELIEGKTGFNRWAKSFEQPMGDVLKVQSEIASAVTGALTSEVGGDTNNLKKSGGTSNAAAYDAYLRGRDLYNKAPDEAGERAALARFDEAIALDPNFAAAHAARARSLTVIGNRYGTLAETREYYDAALKSARYAVEIAPLFADGQSTLGSVLFQGRLDVKAAKEPFNQSRRSGSGDATVLGRFAFYCAMKGSDREAVEAATRSVELDPLNALALLNVGMVHFAARRYPAAIKAINTALASDPQLSLSYAFVATAQFMLGQVQEARASFSREPSELFKLTGLAIVEKRIGNAKAAEQAKARVAAGLGENQLTLYQQAQIHAQWNEFDEAVATLTAAHAAGDSGMNYLLIDPFLDPVRRRPEFIHLLNVMGFA